MRKLKDMAQGDRWPFKYFRLWENQLVDEKFITIPTDVSALVEIKISLRHVDNKSDINDHTLDEVYADLDPDTANIVHWEPDTDWQDDAKLGKYIGRITGTRDVDKVFHADDWFFFYVTAKNEFGRESI